MSGLHEKRANLGGMGTRIEHRGVAVGARIATEERGAKAPAAASGDDAAFLCHEISPVVQQLRIHAERAAQRACDLRLGVVRGAQAVRGTLDQPGEQRDVGARGAVQSDAHGVDLAGTGIGEPCVAERIMAKEAYRITSITSQRSHSSGSDLTMKAAINTPTTPPNVSPSDAPQANLPVWKKRKLATGCSSAQAPIMIGNAAIGCMPSSASVIMQGAYRPMPALISAPRIKLTPTANGNFQPTRLMAAPPPGRACKLMAVNTPPAMSSAIPMVIWIARRDRRATTSAPSQEPAAALRIIL